MALMSAAERATQIWAVLALAARNRQILTYGLLGRLVGIPAVGLAKSLEPVQAYCEQKRLPPLTILVVQEQTGIPGSGFRGATAQDLSKTQLRVFKYDWLKHGAPKPAEFAQAVEHRGS